jgi:hypothetical protein
MKSLALIFSLVVAINQLVSAQSLKAGQMKSDSQTFDVTRVKDHFIVGNIANKSIDKNKKLPDRLVNSGYEQYLHFGPNDISRILSLVSFEYSRINRKIPLGNPLITYYVSESGEILAMRFILPSNTCITIDDLRIIERAIKGKLN